MRPVRNGRLWVGDGTLFDGVKHLLPNRYLDVERLEAFQVLAERTDGNLSSVSDAVDRACAFLQGMLKAVTHRHPVMMAVTAGTDSRTLLAASRDVRGKVYYFINSRPRLNATERRHPNPDAGFSTASVSRSTCTRSSRRSIRSSGRSSCPTRSSPETICCRSIYNVYYRRHAGKVNLLGVGEIGRALWGSAPRNVTPYHLAYALGYTRSRFAVKACEAVAGGSRAGRHEPTASI